MIDIDKLREIGWACWNPIGLEGPPATPADEYDSYLLEAVHRIERNDSSRDVADYLIGVERTDMGLSEVASDYNRVLITVEAINECLRAATTPRLRGA